MTITRYFVILSAAPLSGQQQAANDNERRIANYINLQSFVKGARQPAKPN